MIDEFFRSTNMEKKIVVITGATAGVGRATAREFAKNGATVILLARDQGRLDDTQHEIEALGAQGHTIDVDVSDAAAVEAAVEHIERAIGPIDVWVNNAMVTTFAPLQDIASDDFRRVTEVTYLGTVYATMSVLKRMRARNKGTIIQVGSALAYRSIPLQSAYCGAKHAIRGFTNSVRSELLHDGSRVHITMVQLPGVNTPQFEWCRTSMQHHPQPVGPVYEPEVAAKAIVWASTHCRRELNVGLPTSVTIAVNKWLPGFFDRYLAGHAYEQQFTGEPIPSDRPNNLFHPVATKYTARGSFEERAHAWSPQLQLSLHRKNLGVALTLLAAAAFFNKRRQPARGTTLSARPGKD
jgi:short-subunit dehydrogenase